jgi:hypothetical protein
MATEAKAIGHDGIDACFAGDVGDVVEVAAIAWMIEIDGGGEDTARDRQGRDDQLHTAGRTQRVPELALGAGDLQPPRMRAEDLLHGAGLGQIAEHGTGAMGIDLVDGVGR